MTEETTVEAEVVEPKPRKKAAPKRRNSKRQVIAKRKMTKAVKRAGTPEEAREVIEQLTDELEDQEIAAVEDNRPGRKIRGSKVAWTFKDCVDRFPIVTFFSEFTGPLNFNGVRVQAIAGMEMHVPKCFYDIYTHRLFERFDHKNAMPRDTGFATVVNLGAGALGPESSISQ